MTEPGESGSEDYVSMLREEIDSRSPLDPEGNSTSAYTEQLFTDWCGELLEENGFVPGYEAASWEFAPPAHGTQMKIDGYWLDATAGADEATAAIFVSSWAAAGEDEHVSRKRLETLVSIGAAFMQQAFLSMPPLYRRLEPADPHAVFAEKLWNLRDELRRVTLHVLVNGIAADLAIDGRMLGDVPMGVEVWDARRLIRVHQGTLVGRDEVVVEFPDALPCVCCPTTDSRYEAYLTILSGKQLAEIYDRHGPRLLEDNVRAFLQLSVSVNKGIRKTLHEEPGAFFAYNNGLSATATTVETVDAAGNRAIRRIAGLQIVNGAQTTGSIHRAWRADPLSLDDVNVPIKLTRVNDESRQALVQRVSRYANSQTAVKLDDFSANRPFHVRLEELSRRIWAPPRGEQRWYYERTRGQYQDEMVRQPSPASSKKFKQENPPAKRLTKTDVARYVHAWDAKPWLVALGAQKNFIRFSADWIKDDWLPDEAWFRELVAKAIVFEAVKSCVRVSGVPAYAANVVAYIVAVLSHRYGHRIGLQLVWEAQELSPAVRTSVESWASPVYDVLVASAGGRNVTEWCKKPGCWDAVRELELLPLPDAAPELASASGGGVAGVATNAAVVEEIDLSSDREALLKIARDVVAGRTLHREDAIKELQKRLGIVRLSAQKRAELEGAFEDLTRLAFIDDEDTVRTNEGLAIVRKLIRSGIRETTALVSATAQEWLGKQRVGSRVREQIDDLLRLARARAILQIDDEHVSSPTPQFDSYDDDALVRAILDVMRRRSRMYSRSAVTDAVVRFLGFSQARVDMLERVDERIEALVVSGEIECPSAGWIRRTKVAEA